MRAPDAGLVRLGATAMVLAQHVMTAVMTMTPIHMRDHGHGHGLGRNLGLVGGTALVTDGTPLERRASTQGAVDLAVALRAGPVARAA